MPRNPFAVLGVPADASADAIKAAWRRLARQHHPDVKIGDVGAERKATRTMAEINAAYQELRDPVRRRMARQAAMQNDGAAPGGDRRRHAGTWPPHQPPRRRPDTPPRPDAPPRPDTPPWGETSTGDPGAFDRMRSRPVTARIDTSALFHPRNSILHPLDRSPLPGWPPPSRSSSDREPPRASLPSGPTVRRVGPSLEGELPDLATARDTRLRFGKFAGLTLGDVAEVEPTYVEWIVRTIDKDPEISLAARVVLRSIQRTRPIHRPRLDAPLD